MFPAVVFSREWISTLSNRSFASKNNAIVFLNISMALVGMPVELSLCGIPGGASGALKGSSVVFAMVA